MEEAQAILLKSLENSSISLPEGVSSIKNLTPSALISISAQSLHLIDKSLSFPTSLPDSMAERFKICTEISSSIKNLGYRGDMSFHQFLYPSEEDSYKLVRFLVERLSQSSEFGKPTDQKKTVPTANYLSTDQTEKVDNAEVDLNYQIIDSRLKDLALDSVVPESDSVAEVSCSGLLEERQPDELAATGSGSSESIREEEPRDGQYDRSAMEQSESSRKAACGNTKSMSQRKDLRINGLKQKLASIRERSSQTSNKIEDLRSQEKILKQELATKSLESQHLEHRHGLLKAAVEMALDDQLPVDFYTEKLNKQEEDGMHNIIELEMKWKASTESLEEKRRGLEELLHAQKPEPQEKLQNLKEIELETEAIISEIQKRDEEYSKLSSELEKKPEVPSRKSYIRRITEITKNSRKQDADIERILKDTRELQIESNSIQERLHRTYAIVDETMFRDVKKDPVRLQAHKLLTRIHESFEQIAEKILATDRIRRDIAEQEAKLASVANRNLDVDKLQADLDAIKMENEFLEQQLSH